MRNPERIPKILAELNEVWTQHPDLRLGQLLLNVFESDIYYIEDDELITSVKRFYKKYANN